MTGTPGPEGKEPDSVPGAAWPDGPALGMKILSVAEPVGLEGTLSV